MRVPLDAKAHKVLHTVPSNFRTSNYTGPYLDLDTLEGDFDVCSIEKGRSRVTVWLSSTADGLCVPCTFEHFNEMLATSSNPVTLTELKLEPMVRGVNILFRAV